MQLKIILLEPNTAGNVGAVARAMKNFGFKDLVLVNPKCNHLDDEGMARAMHAKDVLENAEVVNEVPELDYAIATTAVIGGDYNIKRSPVSPEELGERLNELEGDASIGLLLGREDNGLTNEEIKECDFIVTIPSHPEYPTMNLSHAAAIVLYSIHKFSGEKRIGDDIKPIGKKEKEILLGKIDSALDNLEFQTDERRETHKYLWRRIIGKSMLTNREAQALMGLFKKVK